LLEERFRRETGGVEDFNRKLFRQLVRGFGCDPFEQDNSADPEQGLPETFGRYAGSYDCDALVEKKLFDFTRPRGVRKK
jgi:hypothetical protein